MNDQPNAALLRLLESIEAHEWADAREALDAIRAQLRDPPALAAAMAAVRIFDKRRIRQ